MCGFTLQGQSPHDNSDEAGCKNEQCHFIKKGVVQPRYDIFEHSGRPLLGSRYGDWTRSGYIGRR
ncbi:MAG: hypothetical protein MUF23_18425, partial [Pirellula sp.]|nr:hypothetical protein [Pirellula sp.]